MTSTQLRRWRWIHKWSSIVCTAFLLVLCVTGLPLIFADEIDAALTPITRQTPPVSDEEAPLDEALAKAIVKRPGAVPMSLTWLPDDAHRLILWSAPRALAAPGEFHGTVIDLRDGAVLAERKLGTRVTDVIHAIHEDLILGLPGSLLLCLMGLLFVLALISGVVLYAPFMRNLPFATIRRQGAKRTTRLDTHNFVGVVVLAWTLVVGITGIANTLARPLFQLWQADQLAAMVRPWQDKPVPPHVVSAGAAVAAAQRALPNMQPESLAFPYSRFGSPHHYIVWFKGSTTLTSRLETPVLVEAATGRVVEKRQLPWYLRALEVSRPLHFGDYGGLPLKLLWAALDVATIVVLITGIQLLVRPRRRAA
ncbi:MULTISPECIES: PepSY domain-containing protein [unclassified Novosphingobium]|uniref:PepSY-associated TM helix domain-containing protein n=1 Tax=unclassified Novosphingobium TaxID=2644732 RepID=UPI0014941831|nr:MULTISPECIES: PepSY-associated TM helix domain-containing protein [unclassified Novosphingobium]MBB3356911.1 putative iron-regulated membrane protein [Novosphingobium sp. BK256]MBB3373312.1 putative iron-regulated membrane protein [Novosphingobium sp. BK280]MBB3377681.1 putative iron-regulated membrane protein [Novosphingobium sp. BK258]MBB3418908.1 putative iron-regulated membrane protein [Novosphingobium sp. BK267]MBB3450257.1 putative iron-regulated membrane protein [Novosphingobium sp. 